MLIHLRAAGLVVVQVQFQARGLAVLWGRWEPTCPHPGTDTPSEGDCISWALVNSFMYDLLILVLPGLSVFPEKPEIWHFSWNCLILKKKVSEYICGLINTYKPTVDNTWSIFFPHHVLHFQQMLPEFYSMASRENSVGHRQTRRRTGHGDRLLHHCSLQQEKEGGLLFSWKAFSLTAVGWEQKLASASWCAAQIIRSVKEKLMTGQYCLHLFGTAEASWGTGVPAPPQDSPTQTIWYTMGECLSPTAAQISPYTVLAFFVSWEIGIKVK